MSIKTITLYLLLGSVNFGKSARQTSILVFQEGRFTSVDSGLKVTVGTLSGPECASEHQCLEELEEPVIWLLLQAKIGPADHIFAIFFLLGRKRIPNVSQHCTVRAQYCS